MNSSNSSADERIYLRFELCFILSNLFILLLISDFISKSNSLSKDASKSFTCFKINSIFAFKNWLSFCSSRVFVVSISFSVWIFSSSFIVPFFLASEISSSVAPFFQIAVTVNAYSCVSFVYESSSVFAGIVPETNFEFLSIASKAKTIRDLSIFGVSFVF